MCCSGFRAFRVLLFHSVPPDSQFFPPTFSQEHIVTTSKEHATNRTIEIHIGGDFPFLVTLYKKRPGLLRNTASHCVALPTSIGMQRTAVNKRLVSANRFVQLAEHLETLYVSEPSQQQETVASFLLARWTLQHTNVNVWLSSTIGILAHTHSADVHHLENLVISDVSISCFVIINFIHMESSYLFLELAAIYEFRWYTSIVRSCILSWRSLDAILI